MRHTENTMGGMWGMGTGGLAMLATFVLLAIAGAILVLLLRRVVAGDPAGHIRVGALGRLDLPTIGATADGGALANGEVEGFLVIPDVSGYTAFIRMSAFALAHAQYAVSALLSAVIEAADGVLATAKIEGDAVFLYGVRTPVVGCRAITGTGVGAAVGALLQAFYRKRAELSSSNACPCEACRNVSSLELKTVVHSGSLYFYNLRGHREIGGMAAIVAHRLLKNDLDLDRYVLITDAAIEQVTLPLKAETNRYAQSYDEIGLVESTVYHFPVDALLEVDALARPSASARASDVARKLLEGLRGLRPPPTA